MKSENMPLFVWCQNYEGEMGHGDLDDYQPWDETIGKKR
tara:strand:- start:419 stop:535 length:117 start_codon:yes stop_codon:yes gene_type:complete